MNDELYYIRVVQGTRWYLPLQFLADETPITIDRVRLQARKFGTSSDTEVSLDSNTDDELTIGEDGEVLIDVPASQTATWTAPFSGVYSLLVNDEQWMHGGFVVDVGIVR